MVYHTNMSSICLSMIVKNEAHCIIKCLESIKQFINYWIICDTGSTDGTQNIIREYLKDIPGELYEHVWESFEANRNLALNLSYNKSDYILWIDADDILNINNPSNISKLIDPIYNIEIYHGDIIYKRPHLIRNDIKCKWVGVLHEYLEMPPGIAINTLKDSNIIFGGIGNRSKDPNKYVNDALVFEKALLTDPANSRYTFYCAQSYRDAKNFKKAIEFYEKRISMGDWIEEQFTSAFEIAKIFEILQQDNVSLIESAYLRAHNLCPTRAEALCYLSAYCRRNKLYDKAYFYSKTASVIAVPLNGLFVELNCYKWKIIDELAISAFYIGKKEEAKYLNLALISSGSLPKSEIDRIKTNLNYCL